MFYLNLDAETNRILSANTTGQGVAVETLPEGNISDYLYIDGTYTYDPLPTPPEPPPDPTAEKLAEAYEALEIVGVTTEG